MNYFATAFFRMLLGENLTEKRGWNLDVFTGLRIPRISGLLILRNKLTEACDGDIFVRNERFFDCCENGIDGLQTGGLRHVGLAGNCLNEFFLVHV